jgi:hypothetical protein
MFDDVGFSSYVHGAAASLIENVWPPTVMAPDRLVAVVFACTVNVTSPVPVPVPCATSIHGTVFDADQPQAEEVVTVNRPLPPPAAKLCEEGFSVKVQESAVCRMVTV